MQPRIEKLPEKKLIGKRLKISFANNTTADLWRSFMPRRKEIVNNIGSDLYSMQRYAPQFFSHFNPNNLFEKWAAIKVTDFETVPDGMEAFTLESGLYAVFLCKGAARDAAQTFQYILADWLPKSGYLFSWECHKWSPHLHWYENLDRVVKEIEDVLTEPVPVSGG